MHRRVVALSMMVIAGLACSADTLGTAMDSNAEQGSLGDEPGSSEAAESGESGSAGVDEGAGQDTTTTTTTTTSTDEGCTLGSEGCACTGGGGCDPGLECDAGTCVPVGASESTTDSTTTDSTTTDSTTTDSTTTDSTTTDSTTTDSTTTDSGDDPFMCTLSNNCGDYDLASCTCQDCNDNGYCTQYEDCVCPDCTNENVCMGNACENDGACNPYLEGCSCSDCAAHPQCG
jgi:hypothetical protein